MGGAGLSVIPGRDARIPLLARLPRSAGDSPSISPTPIAVRGGSGHLGPPTVTGGYRGLLPTQSRCPCTARDRPFGDLQRTPAANPSSSEREGACDGRHHRSDAGEAAMAATGPRGWRSGADERCSPHRGPIIRGPVMHLPAAALLLKRVRLIGCGIGVVPRIRKVLRVPTTCCRGRPALRHIARPRAPL